jgi:hypothetical protein
MYYALSYFLAYHKSKQMLYDEFNKAFSDEWINSLFNPKTKKRKSKYKRKLKMKRRRTHGN